jgi:hypothetical protein
VEVRSSTLFSVIKFTSNTDYLVAHRRSSACADHEDRHICFAEARFEGGAQGVNSADGMGQFFEGRATQVRVSVLRVWVSICRSVCMPGTPAAYYSAGLLCVTCASIPDCCSVRVKCMRSERCGRCVYRFMSCVIVQRNPASILLHYITPPCMCVSGEQRPHVGE